MYSRLHVIYFAEVPFLLTVWVVFLVVFTVLVVVRLCSRFWFGFG